MSESKTSAAASSVSRRDFLKTSTAAAGAAVAGSLTISRSAHAAGGDTLKVGLIGCGGRGSGAAVNALNADQGAKLVAMADVFEDKVLGARDRITKARPGQVDVDDDHCFADFDGFEKVIQSDVDVVLIACSSRFHPQYLTAAVKAGKHVFVEKPHAVEPPALKVVEAACAQAKKQGTAVVSGLCWRYHTGVRETVQRIQDGAIGDIVAIQECYLRTPYRLSERNPDWTEMQWQMRNWYHFSWLSGDDILQSLIHSIDKAALLLNDEPPLSAFGVGGRIQCVEPKFGDQHDHTAIIYEYANGVRIYGFSRAQAGCFNETSDNILGTKGRCNLLKHVIEGETNWKYEGPKCNMYDAEHVALFASIRDGKPINNGHYMVGTTGLALLGRAAGYTGKKVTWEELINSQEVTGPANVDWNTDPPVKPGEDGRYPCPVPGLS